jgi:hypothetical protein
MKQRISDCGCLNVQTGSSCHTRLSRLWAAQTVASSPASSAETLPSAMSRSRVTALTILARASVSGCVAASASICARSARTTAPMTSSGMSLTGTGSLAILFAIFEVAAARCDAGIVGIFDHSFRTPDEPRAEAFKACAYNVCGGSATGSSWRIATGSKFRAAICSSWLRSKPWKRKNSRSVRPGHENFCAGRWLRFGCGNLGP